MKRLAVLFLTGTIAVFLSAASSATAVDWTKAGKTAPQPSYPFTDLPGVRAAADLKEEEQYSCHTETQLIHRLQTRTFRPSGIPQTVYVCERDGVQSVGEKVPLRGHYQPVR